MTANQAMPIAMLAALPVSNGTQRNATQRTYRQLSHPDIKSSPSVTHTRVQDSANGGINRGRCAPRSGVTE